MQPAVLCSNGNERALDERRSSKYSSSFVGYPLGIIRQSH